MNKRKKLLLVGVAAVTVATVVGACGNSETSQSVSSSASSTTQNPATAPAAAHDHVDAMFAQQMVPHHQQAIEMSDMILAKQGIDPRVLDLAKQIKAAQAPEIGQMQGWMTAWGMPNMPAMPGMSDMPAMDGKMSSADMSALQNAQGVQASRLFLTQMIQHHQGAIAMAQDEIDNGQYPDAIALAKSIVASQRQEIDTMNQILASL